MLAVAQQHSLEMGYRWHPQKCVIVPHPLATPCIYSLYGEPIPQQTSFPYLGVPIDHYGNIDRNRLVNANRTKFLAALATFASLGLNPRGFPPALKVSIYKQFLRPTMEYGLAVTHYTKKSLAPLVKSQKLALRKIFGGHPRSETMVVQTLSGLPSPLSRAQILQAKYIVRARFLPTDSLLSLLSSALSRPGTHWTLMLKQNPLWRTLVAAPKPAQAISSFLLGVLLSLRPKAVLLSALSPATSVFPEITIPMDSQQRSLIIRWRRGWLPGKPLPCLCKTGTLTRIHTLSCPLVPELSVPPSCPPVTCHPADVLLNMLPGIKSSPSSRLKQVDFWISSWPPLIAFLLAVDALTHNSFPGPNSATDHTKFFLWLDSSSQPSPPTRPTPAANTLGQLPLLT